MKEKNEKDENVKKEEFFNERLGDSNKDHILKVYLIKSIDNLTESTNASSKKAHALSKRIVWLNIVLTIATAIGAFATVWLGFFK